jgi:hypothetical protein
LRAQAEDRQRQADQFLAQAHARWQAGDLEGGLDSIERGLGQVPDHPELLTLKSVIASRIKERQIVPQTLAQARDLLRRGELDESLKRIEEGLNQASDPADLLGLREQVRAAIATRDRIDHLLRDCAARYPLDRLADQTGGEVAACYNQIRALSPDRDPARARLEEVAERYASLADGALGKGDFLRAEHYLAQLSAVWPDHGRYASLNRALRVQRERAASEALRLQEIEAKRQAAEEAKRQAAEEARRRSAEETKRRAIQANVPEPTPVAPAARPKPATGPVAKPESPAPARPAKPRSELAGQPRQKGPKPSCREALLKAQLGEPLTATEQEECKP